MALLAVLVLLVVIGGAAASFVWFMDQQQTRAGTRYRAAAALAAAEAGIDRALSVLESVSPDGSSPGRTWRSASYSEALPASQRAGRFALTLADAPDGAIIVTSTGEVNSVSRRLRARVHLAAPALLAALHARSFVRFDASPTATAIVPYGAGPFDRPWIHVAAGRGIWFADAGGSINDLAVLLEAGPGPVDAPNGIRSVASGPPAPMRLLMTREGELWTGQSQQRVDVQQLRTAGLTVAGEVLRTDAFPLLPDVDRAVFRSQAAANTANIIINSAAGEYGGDPDLAHKRDSAYSEGQFAKVLAYLKTNTQRPRLRGVVYVKGGLAILNGQRIEIADGTLVAENTVHLAEGAVLEITHSSTTRTQPGLIILNEGALVVTRQARLRVHGLVYASRVIEIGTGALLDVVGAVAGNDRAVSFRNASARVIIRYDPAVLGTPGLRSKDDASLIAWVASIEELP